MATESIGQEITPTRLIVDWLAEKPEALQDVQSKADVRAWVGETTGAESEAGERVTSGELSGLQEYLEQRVKKDGDLNWLRSDLAKYATIYAPKEIGDLKQFVDWALTRVDWQEVSDFLAAHPRTATADNAP